MEFHKTTYGDGGGGGFPAPPPGPPMGMPPTGAPPPRTQLPPPPAPAPTPPGFPPPHAAAAPQQFQPPPPQAPPQHQHQPPPPQAFGGGADPYAYPGAPQQPPGFQQPPQPPQPQPPQAAFGGGGGSGGGGDEWGHGPDWNQAINTIGMASQFMGHGEVAQMVGGLDQQKLRDGYGKYQAWFGFLKIYFRVTNHYVLSKLKIIALPFRANHRRRASSQPIGHDQEYRYEDPSCDVNGMDMYIPSLALVTYVLLSAAIMGANHTFTPEVLGSQTSWCIGVCVLEVAALQILSMSFGATSKVCVLALMMSPRHHPPPPPGLVPRYGVHERLQIRRRLPLPAVTGAHAVAAMDGSILLVCEHTHTQTHTLFPPSDPTAHHCHPPPRRFIGCSSFLMRAQLMEHFKDPHTDHVLARAQPLLLAVMAWQPFIYIFLISNILGDAAPEAVAEVVAATEIPVTLPPA